MKKPTTSRPFKTDYAGVFPGFAKTKQGAINAASRHMVSDGYKRCTIIDTRINAEVAWVEVSKDGKSIITTSSTVFRRIPRG